MSAIFGIIDFEGRPLKEEWIKAMQADLAHRGPDGQGLYREPSVALGHMLLQVTPESVYDKSPYEEDGLVITANARLDEREAIMDRLDIPKEERDKITDPLLLLRSFRKFGKDFVKDIYGDFAFAIWDKNKRELFCARDQMGIKPFYYYHKNNRFVFSTEIKSIVNLIFVEKDIDEKKILELCIAIYDSLQSTIWKNIYRILPANTLLVSDLQLVMHEFWQPEYSLNKKFKKIEDSVLALNEMLSKVIQDYTRVRGNIGIPLSGGLDSSTIFHFAAKQPESADSKIFTVSSVLDNNHSEAYIDDEKKYIEELLKDFPSNNRLYIYNNEIKYFENLIENFDRLYFLPSFFWSVDERIFHKLSSNSVRRILSGYYGDDTTSNRSVNPFIILCCRGNFLKLYRLIRQTSLSSKKQISEIFKTKILTELSPDIIKKIWHLLHNRDHDKLSFLSNLPLNLSEIELIELRNKFHKLNYKKYFGEKNLTKNIWSGANFDLTEEWDCIGSHYGCEATYPLADRRIVELLLQFPPENFYADGLNRGLIRKAMKGSLPDIIRLRSDKGWYAPGYPVDIKIEIKKFLENINNMNFSNIITKNIDLEKLKLILTDFVENNKNIYKFGLDKFFTFYIVIGLLFDNWLNTRNKNEKSN